MSSITALAANALADGTAMPQTWYLQAHMGAPGTLGANNVAAETTRKVFTLSAGVAGVCSNEAEIQWSSPAATETWQYFTVHTASSGGDCWFISAIASISVTSGLPVIIALGALVLTIPPATGA